MKKIDTIDSIAIISCYYGKWPWYFPYFLNSCKFNPSVDFIIFTDNFTPIESLPGNVIIIHKTIDEIITTASVKLGFKVNIDEPYKLCDFKPAYGYIFSEQIEGYNFWGHGDIDVIYGDIRHFITQDLMKRYDLITTRHDFLSGAFTLFKNKKRINELFMQSKDYKRVFSSRQHFCFDECNFLWKEIGDLKKDQTIFDLYSDLESMTHVVRKWQQQNKLNAFFDFMIIEGVPGNLKWVDGKIIYKNQFEALLYHLIKFKKVNRPSKIFVHMPKQFNISPSKIYIRNHNV